MTSPFAACYNAHGGQAVLAALSTSYATGPRLGGLLFGANETAAEEHPGTPRYARHSVALLCRHILDHPDQDHEDCSADCAASNVADIAFDGLTSERTD